MIFAPFLYYVFNSPNGDGTTSVVSAAIITLVGFAALTAVAMTTRRDLSFLRPLVMWGMIAALGLIVAGVIFGFTLGPIFSVAMIALAGASILYQTQQIVRSYPEWAYVGAAVSLFYLYFAGIVVAAGWLTNVRFVTAFAIVPFAQALRK